MQPLPSPLQSQRFQILRCLGEGGFGVVYQAYDQERKIQVALKTIKRMDAEALYRLKQEFRALADIAHPNLVRLYELMYDGKQWFFAMEMVEGISLTEYIRADLPEEIFESSASLNRFLRSAQAVPFLDPPLQEKALQEHDLLKKTEKNPLSVLIEPPKPGWRGRRRGTLTAPLFQATEGESRDLHDPHAEDAAQAAEQAGFVKLLTPPSSSPSSSPSSELAAADPSPRRGQPKEAPLLYDPGRLRRAFLQLVEGIQALHHAGKMHRDIKPSNVLVTKEGRVVILDFGLAADAGGDILGPSVALAGTPVYMPPEQARQQAPSFAGDWYSVGVMLYEGLVGRLPFLGQSVLEILAEKEVGPLQRPQEIQPKIPDDLDRLCMDLLQPDALLRPTSEEILLRLGAGSPSSSGAISFRAAQGIPLIGREADLLILEEGFQLLKQAVPCLLHLRGPSGIGKSKLIRWFLKRLQKENPTTVILSSRCHQQESLPYKAVDGLIDGLSRFLRKQPPSILKTILPERLHEIRLLFPVLWSVPAIGQAPLGMLPTEAQELRRRAWAALRELLAKIALRQPLLLWIDDLQWGDLDSASLLAELLRPPLPPSLFLIFSSRSDIDDGPFLTSFRNEEPRLGPPLVFRQHTLEGLALSEAEELALRLLREDLPHRSALAAWVAKESGGNPFFLEILGRFLEEMSQEALLHFLGEEKAKAAALPPSSSHAKPHAAASLDAISPDAQHSLDRVLSSLIRSLSPKAREVLAFLAGAGHAIKRSLLQKLLPSGLFDEDTIQILRSRSLLRIWNYGDLEEIEVCHERIAHALLSSLTSDERLQLHLRLATTLEAHGDEEAEILAYHFRLAGDLEKAHTFTLQAASTALDGMAFDHAAQLLKQALLDLPISDPRRGSLLIKLGHALSSLGRGQDAAKAYTEAASFQDDLALQIELQRRAATQLLRCGQIDEGLAVLTKVLEPLDLHLAKTPKRAMLSFLWRRFRLALRGMKSQRRDIQAIPIRDLLRIDACRVVAMEMGLVDTIRAADFQALHLQLALDAGEEYRLALALALEIPYTSTQGSRVTAKTERLTLQSISLAKRIQHPHALGMANLTAGIASFVQGRWRRSLLFCKRAETILKDRCTGVMWEVANAQLYRLNSLLFLGDYDTIHRDLPNLLQQTRERDDLYTEVFFRLGVLSRSFLIRNLPDQTLSEVREALLRWPKQGFQLQQYIAMILEGEVALYRGQAPPALDALLQTWPALQRSLLLYAQFNRIESFHLRARLALSSAASIQAIQPSSARRLLRRAEADLKAIHNEAMPWSNALLPLLHAGIASVRGQTEEAIHSLIAAETALEDTEMSLHMNAARWLLGHLLQGDEGRLLRGTAQTALAEQGVQSIPSLVRMIIPGLWSF